MPRSPFRTVADAARSRPGLLRKLGLAGAALALVEIGTRVTSPNISGPALTAFFNQHTGNWLLRAYNALAGGALGRGALFGLGILPYVSARIMLGLLRAVSPGMRAMSESAEGRERMSRWARPLTVGLALVQSYGFATFVQKIPGVVTVPGPGFVAQTMFAMTTGAVVMMLITESLSRTHGDDDAESEPDDDARALPPSVGSADDHLLNPAPIAETLGTVRRPVVRDIAPRP